ncbi:MAG: alpha/beta hydrolase [Actinomycetota bacterium]
MATEKVALDTADGLRLEGRFSAPEDPAGVAVLCHAHPVYGGSMSNAPIPAIQRGLDSVGWASLRFNFRGVRRSEGTYGGGLAEVKDVAAALEFAARRIPGRPLAVAGWSFGSLVGLRAATADERVVAYAAAAPPVSTGPRMDLPTLPPPERLAAWRARVLAVCGTQDEFCRPDDLHRWAAQVSSTAVVRVLDGVDHYFSDALDELATTVADFIAGNA